MCEKWGEKWGEEWAGEMGRGMGGSTVVICMGAGSIALTYVWFIALTYVWLIALTYVWSDGHFVFLGDRRRRARGRVGGGEGAVGSARLSCESGGGLLKGTLRTSRPSRTPPPI